MIIKTTVTDSPSQLHEGCKQQYTCSKGVNNIAQKIRKETAVKIASAKIDPAKMQRKFPNRGKMAPQPNHESNDD